MNSVESFSDFILKTCSKSFLYGPELKWEPTGIVARQIGNMSALAMDLEHLQTEREKRKR